ncbi:hypothetical protein P3S67_003576 [Capsicum chacoense]
MMLRDACVILNDIGPTEGHVLYKKFWMIQHLGAVVYANTGRDMYLLENQINIEKPNDTSHLGREPLHLLEIFRRVVVTGLDYESTALANRRSSSCCCDINSLISCLGCRNKESSVNSTECDMFRSVTDLKSKVIYLKASGIKSLKGVRFNPRYVSECLSQAPKLVCYSVHQSVFHEHDRV